MTFTKQQPGKVPCCCGTHRPPLPVHNRGARKGRLLTLPCPVCKLTATGRPDRMNFAWNMAVERQRAKRREQAHAADA